MGGPGGEPQTVTTAETAKPTPHYQFDAPILLEILSEEEVEQRRREIEGAAKTQRTQWEQSFEINKGMKSKDEQ